MGEMLDCEHALIIPTQSDRVREKKRENFVMDLIIAVHSIMMVPRPSLLFVRRRVISKCPWGMKFTAGHTQKREKYGSSK